jgi:hypothetical protein
MRKRALFCGLECVGSSFAYFPTFQFLRDVLIRTQSAAVASRRATNLATLYYAENSVVTFLRNIFQVAPSMCGVMVASFIAYSFLSFILLFVPLTATKESMK